MDEEVDENRSSTSTSSLHTIEDEEFSVFDYIDVKHLSKINLACVMNDTHEVLEWIKAGKELNLNDNRGYTPLHYAVKSDSIDVVKILLNQPKVLKNVQNFDGDTPLHIAVKYSENLDIIQLLIEAKCDIEIRNYRHRTALYEACCSELNDLKKILFACEILLKCNASFNCHDDLYDPPILNIIISLYKKININTQYEDWLNLVCMFLYYNVDVNSIFKNFPMPFEVALEINCDELTELMFDYVNDFNVVQNHIPFTLFMSAIDKNSSFVPRMIQAGANINYHNEVDSCLSLSINNYQNFCYIFRNCESNLKCKHELIINVLSNHSFRKEEFVNVMYMMLSDECLIAHSTINSLHYFYTLFINACDKLNVEQTHRINIIYLMLMQHNKIKLQDLISFFEFGFNECFEALLKVNFVIYGGDPEMEIRNEVLASIINPHTQLKRLFEMDVPSLMVLTRDKIRRSIPKKYIVDSDGLCCKYYNLIQKLCVPQRIKDIICLKTLL